MTICAIKFISLIIKTDANKCNYNRRDSSLICSTELENNCAS